MREALPPLIVSLAAAEPSIVRLFPGGISSWLFSVIVLLARLAANRMVSLGLAVAIAARSEPAPLSAVFLTVTTPKLPRDIVAAVRA